MAPMEPAKAAFEPPPREGPSRDDLEKALADSKIDDLKEMARRLAKSHESMNEMLVELEAENEDLKVEKADAEQTIDRFMKELQKLNIGADNTVDPQLLEDPLNFVNRMWEKVKPRDTGVIVSEHVGEIKKPVPEDEQSPQNNEKVRQVVENVQNVVGPLWQRGLGAWQGFQQKMAERDQQAQPAAKKQPKKKKEVVKPPATDEASPAALKSTSAASSTTIAASPMPTVAATEVPPTSSATEAAAALPDALPTAAVPEANAEAEAAAAAADAAESAQEQISSTILIEAELTLDDGSVQIIQVRAADRCKEVANKFIEEHSLKAWFKEPLTKWLKQVESDAVKFPVKISGDLMEIRKQHSRAA